MNNLPIETYESVVQQRDEMEKKLAYFHRENLALIEQAEEVYAAGYNHGHLNTDDGIAYATALKDEYYQTAIELKNEAETPATDAFTRELMARGVEAFAKDWKGAASYSQISEIANKFAAQLRKGINDAQ